jgi:hypothetical protein
MKNIVQFCVVLALSAVLAACGGGSGTAAPETQANNGGAGNSGNSGANTGTGTGPVTTTPSATTTIPAGSTPVKTITFEIGCPDAQMSPSDAKGGLTLEKVGGGEENIPMVSICIPPTAGEGNPNDPNQTEGVGGYLLPSDSQVTPLSNIVLATGETLRLTLVETLDTQEAANAAAAWVMWYLDPNANAGYSAQMLPTTVTITKVSDTVYEVSYTAEVVGNGTYLLNTSERGGNLAQ